MKISPIDIIKNMSGQVCQHSDTYVALNHSSGKMFTGKICNPYTGPASERQIAQQQLFKARANMASEWLLANRPSATNGIKGTADYQLAQRLKKQLMLSNVRQVVCRYMSADGIVNLPASTTSGTRTEGTIGGGSFNPPSGGDNSGGGTTPGGGSGSTSGNDDGME